MIGESQLAILVISWHGDADVEPISHYQVGLRYRWIWPAIAYRLRNRGAWIAASRQAHPDRVERTDFHWSDPIPNLLQAIEQILGH